MSTTTDFDSLKEHILEMVTKDPMVKYIFMGWVQEQFAEKIDLKKLLDEMREFREESNQRFEEINKRFEEINKRFEVQDRKMEQGFKRLEQKIDRLGTRWGLQAETSFRDALASILYDFADVNVSIWREHDDRGHVYGHPCPIELDVVIADPQCLVVAEIKSKANRNDVAAFYRITQVYQEKTGVKPDRCILIAAEIEPSAKELAQRLQVDIFGEER